MAGAVQPYNERLLLMMLESAGWCCLEEFAVMLLAKLSWHLMRQANACRGWESGDVPLNRTLDHQIVVPFPVRSDLSGLHLLSALTSNKNQV